MRRSRNILGGLGAWLWLAITVVPIYYIVVTSLRKQSDYFKERPLSIPRNPTLGAYKTVLQNDFLRVLREQSDRHGGVGGGDAGARLDGILYVTRSGTPEPPGCCGSF